MHGVHGGSNLASGGNGCADGRRAGAGSGSVPNGNDFRCGRECVSRPFQTESCRSAPPDNTFRQNGLFKPTVLRGEFPKGGLHSVAHNEDNFINVLRLDKSLPGMRDDRMYLRLPRKAYRYWAPCGCSLPTATMMAETMRLI